MAQDSPPLVTNLTNTKGNQDMSTHEETTTLALLRVAVETAAKKLHAPAFREGMTMSQRMSERGKLHGAVVVIYDLLLPDYSHLAFFKDIEDTVHKLALIRGWTPQSLFPQGQTGEEYPAKEGGLYELLYSDAEEVN